MKKMNNKGFTLIELLAVIIVLGVVMVISVPNVMNTMNTAKKKSLKIYGERILTLDQKRIKEELTSMFSDYEIDWLAPVREKSMSWDQIRELSRHPLCTIGGHTISHPALNKLSIDVDRD